MYGMAALAGLAGVVASVGLLAVIAAGFALSFDAIGAVGRASRIRAELAWLLPMAVDGAMAVGTVAAVVVRRLGQSNLYPWTVVLVNVAISVACNALHAYSGTELALPAAITMAVSAVPAVNLALSVHLLVALVDALADIFPGTMPTTVPDAHDNGPHPEAVETTSTSGVAPTRISTTQRSRTSGRGGRSARELHVAAWEWAQQNRHPDGTLPSGEELGRAYERSSRWGRYVKRAGHSGLLCP